jgi:predicted nucleic acid-binding protein
MVYVDTSALAKWYLNERGSDDFADWIVEQREPWISTLTALEMRCLLGRRRRADEISRETEDRAFSTFEEDVANGHLFLHPVDDEALGAALALIGRLDALPLRTLDAIHLALARQLAAPRLATADAQMADAASALGLAVVRFGKA